MQRFYSTSGFERVIGMTNESRAAYENSHIIKGS